jgi:hypothetical protein
MELGALKKRLQQHLGDGLVLVIGSGLSCAEGVPGMGPLGQHLVTHIPASLSPDDNTLWKQIYPLIESDGLEAALLKCSGQLIPDTSIGGFDAIVRS